MTEPCFACDGDAVLVRELREVQIGQRSVSVEGEFMRCEACGTTYFLPGQADALQRAAAERIRQEDGLLTGGEIRSFRNRIGLSQADFERLLRVGPKTVVRWERGTVTPASAVDTLLRILMRHPDVLRDLAAERGITMREMPGETPSAPAESITTRLLADPSVVEISVRYRPPRRIDAVGANDTFALSA